MVAFQAVQDQKMVVKKTLKETLVNTLREWLVSPLYSFPYLYAML